MAESSSTSMQKLMSLGRSARHHLPMALLIAVSVAIVAGVAVLPMQTWFQQRELIEQTEREHSEIMSEVDRLESELELLQTDEEIERLSRENFDLVKPGEESYRILPSSND